MVGLLVATIIDEEVDRQVTLVARCHGYVQPTISPESTLRRSAFGGETEDSLLTPIAHYLGGSESFDRPGVRTGAHPCCDDLPPFRNSVEHTRSHYLEILPRPRSLTVEP